MLEFTCNNGGAKIASETWCVTSLRSIGKTHELEVKREGSILHVFFCKINFIFLIRIEDELRWQILGVSKRGDEVCKPNPWFETPEVICCLGDLMKVWSYKYSHTFGLKMFKTVKLQVLSFRPLCFHPSLSKHNQISILHPFDNT